MNCERVGWGFGCFFVGEGVTFDAKERRREEGEELLFERWLIGKCSFIIQALLDRMG